MALRKDVTYRVIISPTEFYYAVQAQVGKGYVTYISMKRVELHYPERTKIVIVSEAEFMALLD